MTIRTATRTVTFTKPFTLEGFSGLAPAGDYEVQTDEELIGGVSFEAYRRVATTITVRQSGETRSYTIDPAELDATLLFDAGLTVVPPAKT